VDLGLTARFGRRIGPGLEVDQVGDHALRSCLPGPNLGESV